MTRIRSRKQRLWHGCWSNWSLEQRRATVNGRLGSRAVCRAVIHQRCAAIATPCILYSRARYGGVTASSQCSLKFSSSTGECSQRAIKKDGGRFPVMFVLADEGLDACAYGHEKAFVFAMTRECLNVGTSECERRWITACLHDRHVTRTRFIPTTHLDHAPIGVFPWRHGNCRALCE